MTNDINCNREAIKNTLTCWQIFITIPINHLLAIPKGVIVAHLIVNGGIQAHPIPVNRVSFVYIVIQIIGRTTSIIGFIHRDIRNGALTLLADDRAWKTRSMFGIVYHAFFTPNCYSERGGGEL